MKAIRGTIVPLLVLVLLWALATVAPAQPEESAPTEGDRAARPERTGEDQGDAAVESDDADDAPTDDRRARGASGDGDDDDEGPEMLSLSFRDMRMEEIARFISEKTGKAVIPHESIKEKRITIVSTAQMELHQAMQTLREALRLNGVIMEEHERIINLRAIEDAAQATLRVIGADEDLSQLDDPTQIVRKVFTLQHYDAVRMQEAVSPMLPTFGSVIADSNTQKIVVTDTVRGLERIAEVIRTLDVPQAGALERKILELEHADATWVVAILKLTLSADEQAASLMGSTNNNRNNRNRRGRQPQRPSGNENNVVALAGDQGPVLLVPEVKRNWIIAVAPVGVMTQIEAWVEDLDVAGQESESFSTYELRFADVDDVAERLQTMVESMPELQGTVQIVPFEGSNRLMISGSHQGRQMVGELLDQLDVETAESRVMRVIQLEYADAESIASSIQELFTGRIEYQSRWGTRYDDDTEVELKVTADARRNSLTIVTDGETMAAIERLIREEWDLPVSGDDVQPRVYTLKYADPVQVRDVLESLFSQRQQSFNYFSFFGGGGGSDPAPVGRLFGQFSFQSLPNSNRLIVTTKNAANYVVIDRLVAELDQPQQAGLPTMIELAHANAEDLAEQLNAILAEPGTLAAIARQSRQLSTDSEIGAISDNNDNQDQNNQQGNQQGQQGGANTMQFWWQRAQEDPTEQPASNLIGKIRVVPVMRRNALMIVAPPAYQEPIMAMVRELDLPGAQVLIHAVIAEVQHDDQTTLGVRLAADPSVFDDPALADQAFGGSGNVSLNQIFAEPFNLNGDEVPRAILDAGINLNVLIQLLIREFGLKVLTEPKLYTADNQEASFFDGQDVSVQVESNLTESGNLNRSFQYRAVGTQLRIRPHITNEGNVALIINVVLSSISPGEVIFGNPVFDRRETTTQVIVQDGETVMLSGIVRQEEFKDVRKLPLLGDIPVLGAPFRSTDTAIRNRELIIFITPRVVGQRPGSEEEVMAPYRDALDRLRRDMDLADPAEDPLDPIEEEETDEEDELEF